MAKIYTTAQVSKHNKKEDVFVIIDQNVYDVTGFISEHPGGEDILFSLAGKDATEDFDEVGHSDDAKKQLAELKIGTVKGDVGGTASLKTKTGEKSRSQGGSYTWLYGVVAVAVGGAAYYFSVQ